MLADSVEPVAQISGGLAEPLTFAAADELLLLLRVDPGEGWARLKRGSGACFA